MCRIQNSTNNKADLGIKIKTLAEIITENVAGSKNRSASSSKV
jgi:hypothetical protein